jgi:hypothetical protein
MAQIDPSIAMSFRPIQIESPINQMAAVAQLRGAQEASQMNALKMQEYQQQQNERNALARLMQSPGADTGSEAFLNEVMRVAPSQFEGFATRALQRAELGERTAARKAETEKRNREMSIEQFQTAVGELASYNTVDDVLSGVQQKLGLGQITQAQADQVISGLPKTDAELPAWQLRTMRNLLPPKERLADVRAERKDEREAARLELEDARLRETQRHQQAMESISGTQAERQLKQLEETQRHNKVMEGLASRRESTDKTKVANTTTDDQGNVTFYNAFGEKLRTELNAGKRSPNIIKAEQAEKNLARDIERTTKELTDITKDGGLIDQSTGSYAGKAIDIGARVIGQAMPGDIAAGKLAPIADMVLKMVPRFEGPQSDKDTRSYKEAAGQLADTTLPREIRKEAGKTILRLMKERKDQFGSAETENVSPSQRQAAPPPPSGFVPDKK